MEKIDTNAKVLRAKVLKIETAMHEHFQDTSRLDHLQEELEKLKAATLEKDDTRIENCETAINENAEKIERTKHNLSIVEAFLKSEKKIVSKIEGVGEKSLGRNIQGLHKQFERFTILNHNQISNQ